MSKVLKNFPYHTQRNNQYNPSGSCNVTCLAMCMNYHGIEPTKYPQLEDELYAELTALGWSRHEPDDLAAICNTYKGVKDTLYINGTYNTIYKAIEEGNPCVLHGYFTRTGHIIVVKGYDNEGLIVNDPWGEWHEWGYDNSAHLGEDLHYSYNLITRTCSPESIDNPEHMWIHVISKD